MKFTTVWYSRGYLENQDDIAVRFFAASAGEPSLWGVGCSKEQLKSEESGEAYWLKEALASDEHWVSKPLCDGYEAVVLETWPQATLVRKVGEDLWWTPCLNDNTMRSDPRFIQVIKEMMECGELSYISFTVVPSICSFRVVYTRDDYSESEHVEWSLDSDALLQELLTPGETESEALRALRDSGMSVVDFKSYLESLTAAEQERMEA